MGMLADAFNTRPVAQAIRSLICELRTPARDPEAARSSLAVVEAAIADLRGRVADLPANRETEWSLRLLRELNQEEQLLHRFLDRCEKAPPQAIAARMAEHLEADMAELRRVTAELDLYPGGDSAEDAHRLRSA